MYNIVKELRRNGILPFASQALRIRAFRKQISSVNLYAGNSSDRLDHLFLDRREWLPVTKAIVAKSGIRAAEVPHERGSEVALSLCVKGIKNLLVTSCIYRHNFLPLLIGLFAFQ